MFWSLCCCFYRLPPAIFEKGGTYEQKTEETEPEEARRGKEGVSRSWPELQIFAFYHAVQRQEGAAGTRRQEEKQSIALNLAKMDMTVEQIAKAVEEKAAVVEKWLADTDRWMKRDGDKKYLLESSIRSQSYWEYEMWK